MGVVKMVGLVSVVAVTDDRVLDAFALEILLLVNAVQLGHQLRDEDLKSSNHEESTSARQPCWRFAARVRWRKSFTAHALKHSWNPS